jgi:broad specificity phosphatase PhoE
VLVSPRIRAQDTCHLAGLGDGAETVEDLAEWDYGDLEGKTTPEIRKMIQGWAIWKGPIPGGETLEQVAIRARRVVERAIVQPGPVALFAHGHILRILTACWLEIEPDGGRLFALGTGSISTLGYEHDTRVITRWNLQGPL